MIIAQLEDGKIYNIESWATFHPETPIKQLILTDGKHLVKTISNCENYYAEREGISTIGNSMVVKESIYGINDLSVLKSELLANYNDAMKKLYEKYDMETARVKLSKLKVVYDQMLERMKKYEVVKFSLEFTQDLYLLNELEVDRNFFKSGGVVADIDLKTILGRRYLAELEV